MIVLLLSISIISLIFGQVGQAVAMLFVVIIYILVELINKFRTSSIMTQLKTISMPTSKVLRAGKQIEIKTNEIVIGDILILTEGVFVPADARLLTSCGLITDEAALTGESLPVAKSSQAQAKQDAPLAERNNCIFSGTTVLDGEGTAIVMAIGHTTEFGKIAQQVQVTKKERTVLSRNSNKTCANISSICFYSQHFNSIYWLFKRFRLARNAVNMAIAHFLNDSW